MTALVTGSNGFLGSALVDRLLARGEPRIRCLVRAASNRDRLEAVARRHGVALTQATAFGVHAEDPPRLEILVGSLGSKDAAARALDGVTSVYHLAAAMSGPAADMFLNTVVGSKNLLEALVHSGRSIKVILVSSFGVYGVGDLPRGHVVNENTPLEDRPEKRDLYSQSKLRQEKLFWEYRARYQFPLTVLRPGVIYGPGGNAFSSRVGMSLFGVFLHLGGDNQLPLSYVDNCAEAIALAGGSGASDGQIYNVHDDDLPTCAGYLARYKREVRPLRSLSIPYFTLTGISRVVERYHEWSKGQLPAIFTPYKTATSWKGNRFDNSKLKSLGWRQLVPTEDALRRTFAYLKEAGK